MSAAAMFLATTASLGIFSCDAPGTKQRNGAIIGALIGGVVGNRVSEDNRATGTLIGAAVGGAAGSYIGCRMQRADQERLAADSQRALAMGQGSSWTSTESGYQAATQVNSTRSNSAVPVALANQVTAPASLVLMGGRYEALRDAVIKAGPATNTRTVGGIGQGEGIDVLGRTGGSAPWAVLEQGGVVIGYVPLSALRALGTVAATGEQGPVAVRTVNVPSTQVCRTVTQTITPPGGPAQSRDVQACVQSDGSWKTV